MSNRLLQAGTTMTEVGFKVWEWEFEVELIRMEHWNICKKYVVKRTNTAKQVLGYCKSGNLADNIYFK